MVATSAAWIYGLDMSKTTATKFKSERAAKMAYTKAERAWYQARDAANGARWRLRHNEDNSPRDGWTDEEEAAVVALEAEEACLADAAHETYKAVIAQGFWVHSYHFGHNPTRDLIRANID